MKYRSFILLAIPVGISAALASCTPVTQLDSAHFSQPARHFQERGALGNDCGLTSQIESGRIGSASSSASGSC